MNIDLVSRRIVEEEEEKTAQVMSKQKFKTELKFKKFKIEQFLAR